MNVFPRWLRRSFLVAARRERLAGPVYAAMVDNLFGTLVGFAALGFASVLLGVLTFVAKPGIATSLMLAAIVAIVVARVALMVLYRKWKRREGRCIREVVDWEIAYALIGVALMVAIGVVSACNISRGQGELALVVAIIVDMGIAGCIAGRNGSRPKIVRQQLVAVFVPVSVALVMRQNGEAFAVLGLIVLFVLATLSSVRAVYATLRSALDGERQVRNLSKRIKHSVDLFDAALNNMTSGLLLFDGKRRLVVANERVRELFGRTLIEGMIGRPTTEISLELYDAFGLSEAEGRSITDKFKQAMDVGGEATLVVCDHLRQRTFDLRLRVMSDGRAVFNVDDVTDKRAKDREIFRLAHHDALTGLHNRVSLAHHLWECLERGTEKIVVMYLDLDRFKEVNDEFGHAIGDEVLVEAARRLSACVRKRDYLARIGGDEFILVCGFVDDELAGEGMALRLIEAVSAPYFVGMRKISLGASVGLCLAGTGKGENAVEEALRAADVALYEAKLQGRARAIWYDPEMDDRARLRRDMIVELREALATGRGLALHYQPVFDCRTGRIVACEALTRWTHATYGVVPPSTFIPLAEANDLIRALGRWCLEKACTDALAWPDPAIKVAVNVSGLQFHQDEVAGLVREVLGRTGLAPGRLELEITESVLAGDLDMMTVELDAVASLGVSIALDDFGTGFSSLSLVHKLPLDKVKLDRSFVAQLDADPTMVSLIASIIQMMQVMRKVVVIEGVETAEQLALVTSGQGRFVQGFHFSRPLPQDDLMILFARQASNGAGLALAG